MSDPLSEYASASPQRRRIIRAGNSAKAAQAAAFKRIGYRNSVPSAMPRGASLSPTGDIGELRQKEALTVFPVLQKMTDHLKRPARRLPLKEKWTK